MLDVVSTVLAIVAAGLLAYGTCGCTGIMYRDTVTPEGLRNLHMVVPGVLRVAHPTTAAQWTALRARLLEEPGDPDRVPLFVQLHDDVEGDDAPFANASTGWQLIKVPLRPQEDKPWTVAEASPKADVLRAVDAVLLAHHLGQRIAFGCFNDRDRGGLVAALVSMRLLHWSERQAWGYMQSTGSRIVVLPGLLTNFLETEDRP